MALVILALLIGVPLIEIAVMIEIGGLIGLFPTLAIIVLSAVAGTALLRHQGLATLARVRTKLSEGGFPLSELFDAACLLVAGVLLLTPGFVTDGFGLALLLPPVRGLLKIYLVRRLAASGLGASGPTRDRDNGIIDVEFRDVTDSRPDSGVKTGEATDAAASDKTRDNNNL